MIYLDRIYKLLFYNSKLVIRNINEGKLFNQCDNNIIDRKSKMENFNHDVNR